MIARLKSEHLHLDAELVGQFFEGGSQVLMAFKPAEKALLLAPPHSQWFGKMHEAQQTLLKLKNAQGDCATSLRTFMLDYDLNPQDRELSFTLNEKTQLLKIDLS